MIIHCTNNPNYNGKAFMTPSAHLASLITYYCNYNSQVKIKSNVKSKMSTNNKKRNKLIRVITQVMMRKKLLAIQ